MPWQTRVSGVNSIFPIPGIRLSATAAQIRKIGRNDLVLIEIAQAASSAAVFTKNAFCAAPVLLCKQHLATSAARYLLINSGNANAGTGAQGLRDAQQCCAEVAKHTGCDPSQVLPFSTGVIGEPLPVPKINAAVPALLQGLSSDAWTAAAQAIMTTDTTPKLVSREFSVQGKRAVITGIAKGAGMIRPNMATMLAFIATDVTVSPAQLHSALQIAMDQSFNRITVDGDMSTNDSCVLIATGQGAARIESAPEALQFQQVLNETCAELAKMIVRDGEGATKFMSIQIREGKSNDECLQVAYAIAHSPLVKTAFFASDPNWGRILAAVGYAGLTQLDVGKIKIFLDDVCIVDNGARARSYTEAQGQGVMRQRDITITVRLGRGNHDATVWTCDLSHDYVRINAEYRS
ncbi:MAG: bifunctional glutamate N-acetyltransferase/amino-acid acetyltransferase ArgJ [Gammaproteobacteria bacterium]|nr:bifunctional glutamate N-acetyltransferase/amino-acid acetyltransferase ArgJ [Gammaproteobacteria bacterium]